jgi:hypothetical protein
VGPRAGDQRGAAIAMRSGGRARPVPAGERRLALAGELIARIARLARAWGVPWPIDSSTQNCRSEHERFPQAMRASAALDALRAPPSAELEAALAPFVGAPLDAADAAIGAAADGAVDALGSAASSGAGAATATTASGASAFAEPSGFPRAQEAVDAAAAARRIAKARMCHPTHKPERFDRTKPSASPEAPVSNVSPMLAATSSAGAHPSPQESLSLRA